MFELIIFTVMGFGLLGLGMMIGSVYGYVRGKRDNIVELYKNNRKQV